MIGSNIVKEQLESYLQAVMPKRDIKIPIQAPNIDAAAVVGLVEDSMSKLRDLIDSESKKMVIEIAKDSSMAFDSLLRVFISFCQHPDQDLDIQRIESCYENYKTSFIEKYKSFYSGEFQESETVFMSMTSALEELKSESKQLAERLSEMTSTKALNKTQSEAAETVASKTQPEPEKVEKKKAQEPVKKSEEGLLSRWLSKLKPKDDGYVKTDLGKDSSGMRWDPVKKKWCFDDDVEEEEEQVVKKPPKKGDLEKKKEEAEAKKTEEGGQPAEEKKDQSIVDSLLKPRSRNIERGKVKGKTPGGGPRVPKVTAKMFDEINAVAETFTIEQQRELIVFELKEKIRAILEETSNQQTETLNLAEALREQDEDLKIHMARLLDQTMARVYCQIRQMNSEAEDSMNQSAFIHVGKESTPVTLNQCTQTTAFADGEIENKYLQQVRVNAELTSRNKLIEIERSILTSHNLKLQDFCSQVSYLLSETTANLSPVALHQSDDTSSQLTSLLSSSLTAIKSLKHRLSSHESTVSMMTDIVKLSIVDIDRKDDIINRLIDSIRDIKHRLMIADDRLSISSIEKYALINDAKAMIDNAAWWQNECRSIDVNNGRLTADMAIIVKNERLESDKMEGFLRGLKEKVKRDREEEAVRQRVVEERFRALHKEYSERVEGMKSMLYEAQKKYENLAETAYNQIRAAANDLNQMQSNLDSSEAHIQELASAYDIVVKEKQHHEIAIGDLEREVKDLKGQLAIKYEESDLFKSQLEAAENELEATRSEINRLSADYNELTVESQDKLSDLKDQTDRLVTSILEKLTQFATDHGVDLSTIPTDHSSIDIINISLHHISSLITANIDIVSTADMQRSIIDDLNRDIIAKQCIIDEMSDQHRYANSLAACQSSQKIKMEESLVDENQFLRSQLESVNERLLEACQTIDRLNQMKADQLDQIKSLTDSLESTQRQLYEINDESISKTAKIDDLIAAVNRGSKNEEEKLSNVGESTGGREEGEFGIGGVDFGPAEEMRKDLEVEREARIEAERGRSELSEWLEQAVREKNALELEVDRLMSEVQEKELEINGLKQSSVLRSDTDGDNIENLTPVDNVHASDEISDKSPLVKSKQKDAGLKEAQEHMISQNRRIELLQMDLEEANGIIDQYKKERDDLKSKFFNELRTAAESNPEAKELLETLLVNQK